MELKRRETKKIDFPPLIDLKIYINNIDLKHSHTDDKGEYIVLSLHQSKFTSYDFFAHQVLNIEKVDDPENMPFTIVGDGWKTRNYESLDLDPDNVGLFDDV